ncbi:MAG: cysS [Bacillales bacterium]|jgi:cysteinyl-tRNA synthetase|nr:cysS [Bacillales bacterium]
MKIYNTLTRQKEDFIPLEPGKVKMYVCGPTVYNYIHIGNGRSYIAFDTIRNYLEYKGYEVNFISNFTDVDDKLIHAANELKLDVPTVAERFIEAFFNDTAALGCRKATHHPRVMDHMDLIIEFVGELINKGMAYESEGDVYYRTRKFAGYGKLSHQSVDELKVGARVETGDKKEDPLDFALWKAAKPGEIYWESPWGYGRPGWHIECSAMARKYLGDTIDIHAGGQDLTFPHHENEIAQSEALTGKPFARYWMHNGFLNIDNEKMSKSLGNFLTVHEMIKEFDPQVFRFLMLSVHYRNPINYSLDLLESAKNSLDRLRTTYQNLKHRQEASTDLTENDQVWIEKLKDIRSQFETAMDDDFNTANAVSALFELSKQGNYYLLEKNTTKQVVQEFLNEFETLFNVLGLKLELEENIDELVENLIEERIEARKNRDFKRSDEIRDQLKEMNIVLEDTAQGTRWKRLS